MKILGRYARKFRNVLLQTVAISLSADNKSNDKIGILRPPSTEYDDGNNMARIAMKGKAKRKLLQSDARFAHCSTMGQFRATRLWNSIIGYLKSNVQLARRRCQGCFYEESFTGKDAVNAVLEYVRSCGAFNGDINRKKCVKLCQTFMNKQIFKSVLKPKRAGKNITFVDSASKLYRFNDSSDSDEEIEKADDTEASAEEEMMYVTSAMRLISGLTFDDDEIMNKAFIDAHFRRNISKYCLRVELKKGLTSKWFDDDDIMNKAFTDAHHDSDLCKYSLREEPDKMNSIKWFEDDGGMNKAFIDAYCESDLSKYMFPKEIEMELNCKCLDGDDIMNKAFFDTHCGGNVSKHNLRKQPEMGHPSEWFDDDDTLNKAFFNAQ